MHLAKNHKAHLNLIHIIHEHFYFNSITPIADPASTIYQDNQDELKKAIKKVEDHINNIIEKSHILGVEYDTHVVEGDSGLEIFKHIEEPVSNFR